MEWPFPDNHCAYCGLATGRRGHAADCSRPPGKSRQVLQQQRKKHLGICLVSGCEEKAGGYRFCRLHTIKSKAKAFPRG